MPKFSARLAAQIAKRCCLSLPLLGGLVITAPAHAGLLGTNLSLTVYKTSISPANVVFPTSNATVINPGAEFSAGPVSVDATDTTLSISFNLTNWNSDVLIFSFVDSAAGSFSNVVMSSSTFPNSAFTSDSTHLDFSCCSTGQNFPTTGFNVTFTGLGAASAPEPASLAIFGMGRAGLALRQRRAKG